MLTSTRALTAVRDLLEPEHFYRPSHGILYRRMIEMADDLLPVDAVTLCDELEKAGELSPELDRGRVQEIAALTPTAANIEHYARIVREHALSRRALSAAQHLEQAAYNGGVGAHPEIREEIMGVLEGGHGAALPKLDLGQLLAGPTPETDWLWNGWLAWEDCALLVGDPGVGKSLLLLGLSEAIRRGSSFLGEPTSQARVGIIDLENPLSEVHKRLRRVGLDANTHDGITYIHAPPLRLTDADGISRLRATIAEHGLELIIIDSFRRACPGVDENDSAAISAVFAPLRHLTQNQRRVIVVVHHARKRQGSDQDSGAGQMTRGSGDFLAVVDTQLYVRRKESGVFTLEHGKSRRGMEHASIQVRVSEADDEHLTFTNEGTAVIAESKLETFLVKIIEALREAGGGPLTSSTLAVHLGVSPNEKRSFYNALRVGFDKNLLGKVEPSDKKQPTEWSLTADTW